MRIAAASCAGRPGPPSGSRRPLDWLGRCPSALYLHSPADGVLAILTRDAVRLPGAVVIGRSARELPLTALVADGAVAWSGGGEVGWLGPAGPVTVVAVGSWSVPRLPAGPPRPAAIDQVRAALSGRDIGVPVTASPDPDALLGRGPGLTPSGDDVLAGYLLARRVFGSVDSRVANRVRDRAAARTTLLSAQLLGDAAAGRCAPPIANLLVACTTGRGVSAAVTDLFAVGATSGAALAAGVVAAARSLAEPSGVAA